MKVIHKYAKYVKGESLVQLGHYGNGRLAIRLIDSEDGSPQAVASVNLPGEPCPDGHCFLKTYSENEGIAEDLIANGIVSQPISHSLELGAPLVKLLKAPHGVFCDCDACEGEAILDQMIRMNMM